MDRLLATLSPPWREGSWVGSFFFPEEERSGGPARLFVYGAPLAMELLSLAAQHM